MSKGFCILAQNNKDTDYVKQAYVLACSIHKFNNNQKVSLITNDYVPVSYRNVFDHIIPIPWSDDAKEENWKIHNRWKTYHITPYDETIVMDSDMLVLSNIEHWWNELSKRELFFVSNVTTYKGISVTSNYYRKMFVENDLPNLYSGLYYFKKTDQTKVFFNLLELIVRNWKEFYDKFAPKNKQDFCSIDTSAAIASKLLDNAGYITDNNSFIKFTHMKPKIQNWQNSSNSWIDTVEPYVDSNGNLFVGNFLQLGVFHYVESKFLTDQIIKIMEDR